jgi:type VI protein secretion system component VasA
MDELLRYYEEELGLFGQFAREFRARYPKPANCICRAKRMKTRAWRA